MDSTKEALGLPLWTFSALLLGNGSVCHNASARWIAFPKRFTASASIPFGWRNDPLFAAFAFCHV